MNILKRFLSKTPDKKAAGLFYPGTSVAGGDLATPHDYHALAKAYVSFTYVCATHNANSVGQSKLRLYAAKTNNNKMNFKSKEVDKQTLKYLNESPELHKYLRKSIDIVEIQEHPFLDLIERPNPFTTEMPFLRDTQLSQELTGNNYWYIVFQSVAGKLIPYSLWILPADRTTVIPDRATFIGGYKYRSEHGVKETILKPEEVVHHKMANPESLYYGNGPLQAIYRTHNISERMDTYEESLFKNMGRVEGMLTTDEDIGEEDAKRLLESFYDNYGSGTRAGKVFVGTNGVDYKTISVTPKELSFLLGRKVTKEKVANAFGVPISMLTMDAVGSANAVTGEYQYAKRTLLPRLKLLEQNMNAYILPYYDERLFVAYDNPVPEDEDTKIKKNVEYVRNGIFTPNEARVSEGKDPMEGGDELKSQPSGTPFSGGGNDAGRGDEFKRLAQQVADELDKELAKFYE